jgi:CRP-like cAMP-binding protein
MGRTARSFNAQAFLDSAGLAKRIVTYRRAEVIFSQDDPCDSVMYIQKGGVRLSALSKAGRDVVVAMLGPGDFFGEGCLAGQPIRIASATAITSSTVLVIKNSGMMKALRQQHGLSDRFIAHMLARNVSTEQDLLDHIFDRSEQQLARALLLLARYGRHSKPRHLLSNISLETLSQMVGITRSRVTFFMNKFKKLGFIGYKGTFRNVVTINNSLLSVVLHE